MKQFKSRTFIFGILTLALFGALISGAAPAQAPQKINYQGYLADSGGTPVNGNAQIRFAIYDAASGGNAMWSETQNVAVSAGRYSVLLGSITPLALTEAKPYWLGVKVGSDAEMTPRKEMTGTLYDVIQGNLPSNGENAWIVSEGNAYREGGKVGIGGYPVAVDALQVLAAKPGERVGLRVWNTDTTNPASDAMLYARTETGGGDPILLLGLQGVINWFIGGDRSDGSKLKIGRTGLATIDSGSTVMTFDNSGRVGIGTTTPEDRFHVNADSEFGMRLDTPNTSLRIYEDRDVPGWIRFRLYKGAGFAFRGTVRAREIVVTDIADYWADFVFEDDYELMPLHEVEQHIKTHKHLPGVPTEREVSEHGVSLGEMQATLLQKVEELTLHLIDQDKRLMSLQQENDRLRKELSALRNNQ